MCRSCLSSEGAILPRRRGQRQLYSTCLADVDQHIPPSMSRGCFASPAMWIPCESPHGETGLGGTGWSLASENLAKSLRTWSHVWKSLIYHDFTYWRGWFSSSQTVSLPEGKDGGYILWISQAFVSAKHLETRNLTLAHKSQSRAARVHNWRDETSAKLYWLVVWNHGIYIILWLSIQLGMECHHPNWLSLHHFSEW